MLMMDVQEYQAEAEEKKMHQRQWKTGNQASRQFSNISLFFLPRDCAFHERPSVVYSSEHVFLLLMIDQNQ